MTGIITSIVAAILLTAIHVGAVSAFAQPLALLHLPLIAIVMEVSAFRFTNAYVIAGTTGIVMDLLVRPSAGAETGMLLVLTFVLITLFTRVVTNASLPALLALTGIGFLGLHLMFLGRDMIGFTLSGDDVGLLFGWDRVLPLVAGLAAQIVATALFAVTAAAVRRAVGSVFVLR